jgi:hypothetical protein
MFAKTNPESVLPENLDVDIHDNESDQNTSIHVDEPTNQVAWTTISRGTNLTMKSHDRLLLES